MPKNSPSHGAVHDYIENARAGEGFGESFGPEALVRIVISSALNATTVACVAILDWIASSRIATVLNDPVKP